MTQSQVKLLKLCIEAYFHSTTDDRLVEIGRFTGISQKTAKSLVDCGLVEYRMPSWATETTNQHVILRTKEN